MIKMLYPENSCPECENPSLTEKEFHRAYADDLLCNGHSKFAETSYGSFLKKLRFVVSQEWYGYRVTGTKFIPSLFGTAHSTIILWNDPHHYGN
jgi:hypothetical protein